MDDKTAKSIERELKGIRKAAEQKAKELRLIRESLQDDTAEEFRPEVSD